MTLSRRVFLMICLALSLLFLGCSSKPDIEIQAAQSAMDKAIEEHSAEFAAKEYASAKGMWDDAQAMLAESRYGDARSLLRKARSRFNKAFKLAKAKRARVLRETKGLQTAVQLRYKSIQELMGTSGSHISAARKKSLEGVFAEIEEGMKKIGAQLEAGDYSQAKTRAKEAMDRIFKAEAEVKDILGGKTKT